MLQRLFKSLGPKAVAYYDEEPVRVHTAVSVAVVTAAAAVGLVLSAPVVLAVAGVLVPLIIAELRGVVASPATQEALLEAAPPTTVAEVRAEEGVPTDLVIPSVPTDDELLAEVVDYVPPASEQGYEPPEDNGSQ